MYIFELFTVSTEELLLKEVFFEKPLPSIVRDLVLGVDTRSQPNEFRALMEATGEDIYFATVDEDGWEEDDIFSDGVYASLRFVEGEIL